MIGLNLVEARKMLELSLAEYSILRAAYWSNVFDAVIGILLGDKTKKEFIEDMNTAIFVKYTATALLAWNDGGSNESISAEALALTELTIQTEYSYAGQLAERLNILVKEDDFDIDINRHEAFDRADGYARSMDIFYAIIRLMASRGKMLTFVGEDGAESCSDCQKYKGQRHRASWWVSHNAVPPNRDFECHGYRCLHVLVDDSGKLYTI